MVSQKIWIWSFAFYFAILFVCIECGVITPREMDIRRAHQISLRKRPFCNAFTGCGKKRSDPSSINQISQNQNNNGQDEEIDNSINDIIDLNAEPAVEDLMRQIMSQAKLWEAIQEANQEIQSQKMNNIDHQNHYPIAFNAQ